MDENIYEVQLVLKTEYGEFKGIKTQLTEEHYNNVVKMSKTFYKSDGFELTCEDGSYMIFSPEVVKKSILIINKNIIKNDITDV